MLRAQWGSNEVEKCSDFDDRTFWEVQVAGLGGEEFGGGEVGTLFLSRVPRGGEFMTTAEQCTALPVPVFSRSEVAVVKQVPTLVEGGFGGQEGGRRLTGLEVARALSGTLQCYSSLPFKGSVKQATDEVANGQLGEVQSALEALRMVASLASCRMVRLVIDEAESLSNTEDSWTLGCCLQVQLETGDVVYGEMTYYDEETEFEVPLPLGVALASSAGLSIYLPRECWREAACRVEVVKGEGGERRMQVEGSQAALWKTPKTAEQLKQRVRDREEEEGARGRLPEAVEGKETWQLAASDVQGLTDGQMRYLLRSKGVACARRQGRGELVAKLAPLLDEVERGRLLLSLAISDEDYQMAQALAEQKSERAVVKGKLEEAIKGERYGEAAALQERLEILTASRADITADEGSYDRFLDADDWYTETIVRQRKAMQRRLEEDG